MQSLLRAKLKKKEKGVEGLEGPEFRIIMDVIASAMGTLCKSVAIFVLTYSVHECVRLKVAMEV